MDTTWKRLAVTIGLDSPLALGEQKPNGDSAEALDYLPAARLRGAAAAVLLADGACSARSPWRARPLRRRRLSGRGVVRRC